MAAMSRRSRAAPGSRTLRRPLPAYLRIEAELESRVLTGELPVGSKLPPERELATILDVSRITVRQALARLERRGYVRRVQGSGTYVAQPKLRVDATHLRGFYDTALSQGVAPRSRLIACSTPLASDHVRLALGLAPGARVHEIVRVRSIDGMPVVIETSFLPADLLPGFAELDLEGSSIYGLMTARYGIRGVRATESLEAVVAGPDEAALLELSVGSPLMLVERIAWDAEGRAIEHARDLYRGDRSLFVAELTSGEDGSLRPDRRHVSVTSRR
jgi:GntR family transcriptional regulator